MLFPMGHPQAYDMDQSSVCCIRCVLWAISVESLVELNVVDLFKAKLLVAFYGGARCG